MDALPEISVIVPVYNVAGYVAPCLQSLRDQTYADFECIVVDDGSTDGSAHEAAAAIAGESRFRLVYRTNGGLSAARNTGLAEAAGRFIAFVDSDDRVAPEFLETLHAAVTETRADWAACAVRMVRRDGSSRDLSAIHGRAHPIADARTVLPLETWPEVIALWPSAWNKLYRRTLIEGMRFVPSTYYEDHPWYHEAAARTDRIAYVPEPLYWQSQGREGQITRDGGERVFEQFDVLERSAEIMQQSAKPEARQGLQRLTSRLTFERQGAIADPDRRLRFAQAGKAFMARHGLRHASKWDPAISLAWSRVMDGEVPVSAILAADRVDDGLRRSLASLAKQTLRDREILLVQVGNDDTVRQNMLAEAQRWPDVSVLSGLSLSGLSGARNRGLEAARGLYVVFLDAGDVLLPQTLWLWTEAMLRSNAGLGLSQFRLGGPQGKVHAGTHDGLGPMGEPLSEAPVEPTPEARLAGLTMEPLKLPPHRIVQIHALPSAKIFRRRRLLESALRFGPEPLSAWVFTIQAGVAARRMVSFDWPGVTLSVSPEDRRLWRAPRAPSEIAIALDRLADSLDPMAVPQTWRTTLFARAVWEKLNFAQFPDDAARARFEVEVTDQARQLGIDPASDAIDSYVGPRVRALLGGQKQA